MEKLIKFLFVGGSPLFMVFKWAAWLMGTLLLVSILEGGGNDGEIKLISGIVLALGLMAASLSVALTLHYERERKPEGLKNVFPGHRNPPPVPAKPMRSLGKGKEGVEL